MTWIAEPYGCAIYAICGAADITVRRYLTREGCMLEADDMRNLRLAADDDGKTHTLASWDIVIRLRDRTPHPEAIAHEAAHAAGRILRRAGLRFSEKTEEAYAYLIDNIVGKVWDAAN